MSLASALFLSTNQRLHGSLILANVFFGTGAVLGALGLPATHPLVFALLRQLGAGILLLTISVLFYGSSDKSSKTILWGWLEHWKVFLVLGLTVFGNQAAFIVGIKLAGPIAGSVWQPSQPIFTAAICMALGWEPVLRKRLVGILVAFVGCVIMVMLKARIPILSPRTNSDQEDQTDTDHETMTRYVIGNVLFFSNCLCMSLYVIVSKRILTLYPPVLVTAWSYNAATVFMFPVTILATTLSEAEFFFCPECPMIIDPIQKMFYIPLGAVPALLYYIVFASVGSYGLIVWANQHATGTLVMSYTVLQPVTSSVLTTLFLVSGMVSHCLPVVPLMHDQPCLDYPTLGTVCGMMGVVAGLSLIISTEPTYNRLPDNVDLKRNDCKTSEMVTILTATGV